MEQLEIKKTKEIINLINTAEQNPNKPFQHQNFEIEFTTNTIYGICFFVKDKKTKYYQKYYDRELMKQNLILRYSKPTPQEKANCILDYFNYHNKNLTKKQFEYLQELTEVIKGVKKWNE